MADTYLTVLRKKIRGRMNELADDIAMGSASDFSQYQRMVGTIEGLAFAEMELVEMSKGLIEDEDLDIKSR